MEVELEDAGPLEKKLSITVPAKLVESRFAVAYRELRREVELPGFRKGKVPRKVLEQRFGERIAGEVVLELASKTVDCKLQRGDVISMWTQGGGAYGPAERRDAEAIARDLREEKITPEAARERYGYKGTEQ